MGGGLQGARQSQCESGWAGRVPGCAAPSTALGCPLFAGKAPAVPPPCPLPHSCTPTPTPRWVCILQTPVTAANLRQYLDAVVEATLGAGVAAQVGGVPLTGHAPDQLRLTCGIFCLDL